MRAGIGKPLNEITYGELWRLTTSPEPICLVELVEVDPASKPRIAQPAPVFTQLKSLTVLRFQASGYVVRDWSNITAMNWLEELHIKLSNIASVDTFPNGLENMTNLKKLTYHSSEYIQVPDCFYRLTNLEEVNLSNSKINHLPRSLFTLPNLKKLNLSSTAITLDSRIGQLAFGGIEYIIL